MASEEDVVVEYSVHGPNPMYCTKRKLLFKSRMFILSILI